uniref:7TM_GPCR_Srx domain-containing protein n=1 Tax=Caenorhabditis tropicalis TaxID=1561998 RepID=A0A1I7SZ86_9PELO
MNILISFVNGKLSRSYKRMIKTHEASSFIIVFCSLFFSNRYYPSKCSLVQLCQKTIALPAGMSLIEAVAVFIVS